MITAALLTAAARGAIVYDNSSNFEGLFNDSKLESGDEVTLAGTARLITEFAFEYYGEFSATGDETARVRFYKMDGAPGENPFATPGTLLYESSAFSLQSGYRTVTISDLALFVPGDTFMWSVEFSGVTEQESVGLLYYDPPTVGSSDAYFWEEENGVWSAVATDDAGNNFGARVTAVQALQITQVNTVEAGVALTLVGTTSGRTYTIEYKTDLSQATWQRGPSVIASGSTATLTDTTAGTSNFRVYRIEEV
jgi:hypothetical protein